MHITENFRWAGEQELLQFNPSVSSVLDSIRYIGAFNPPDNFDWHTLSGMPYSLFVNQNPYSPVTAILSVGSDKSSLGEACFPLTPNFRKVIIGGRRLYIPRHRWSTDIRMHENGILTVPSFIITEENREITHRLPLAWSDPEVGRRLGSGIEQTIQGILVLIPIGLTPLSKWLFVTNTTTDPIERMRIEYMSYQ